VSAVTLRDPESGRDLLVAQADLAQSCGACATQIEPGQWVIAWEGRGWVHIAHLPRVLMSMTMSREAVARAKARVQLDGAHPGDRTIVTHELLTALGMETQ
jgi:hypothetical protein